MMIPRPQPRVLLMEPNGKIAAPICAILERNGFRVDVASDPSDAMQRVEQPFVVLIVDLKVGERDGFTLVEWLQTTRNHLMPRLIVISGGGEDELVQALKEIGVCDVVPKPVDAEKILRAVYDCLDKAPTYALQ